MKTLLSTDEKKAFLAELKEALLAERYKVFMNQPLEEDGLDGWVAEVGEMDEKIELVHNYQRKAAESLAA